MNIIGLNPHMHNLAFLYLRIYSQLFGDKQAWRQIRIIRLSHIIFVFTCFGYIVSWFKLLLCV